MTLYIIVTHRGRLTVSTMVVGSIPIWKTRNVKSRLSTGQVSNKASAETVERRMLTRTFSFYPTICRIQLEAKKKTSKDLTRFIVKS